MGRARGCLLGLLPLGHTQARGGLPGVAEGPGQAPRARGAGNVPRKLPRVVLIRPPPPTHVLRLRPGSLGPIWTPVLAP